MQSSQTFNQYWTYQLDRRSTSTMVGDNKLENTVELGPNDRWPATVTVSKSTENV